MSTTTVVMLSTQSAIVLGLLPIKRNMVPCERRVIEKNTLRVVLAVDILKNIS